MVRSNIVTPLKAESLPNLLKVVESHGRFLQGDYFLKIGVRKRIELLNVSKRAS